ncbi:heavy metal translocating P-type ATPase [Prosthecobacter sp.]|uniref:heavy metal translocating P-type ATPase n=1 Tax=Prosthecobacter sp. TaxID=1965333 RepID=UPI00248A300E|nr:heavy metal translocating P-type ATPase [Prosthecobacter sp.]MDI1312064.1 heavy metal translocating P-type ATPase [Prosthecobacter sp.]
MMPEPSEHDQGPEHGGAPHFLPHWMQERWTALKVAVAGLALAVGFFGEEFFELPHAIALGFYLLAYLAGGYDVAREALPAMFRGKLDIDLLMIAAAAGAALLGEWAEGAFLLFLFALGHAGEQYALDRARNAVGVLGKLMPRTAFAKRGARLEEVPVEELAVDDVVVVKPGERVPVDGVITAGESSIDQSAITGESVPVECKAGDEVFAGTINQDNALDVRMTRLARDNTLARVMKLVAEAQEQKSPTQRFTETFARRFVPAVLIGTLLVIVLLPLLFGWTWSASFYRGMLLLVAASPCALAIGTPAAVLAGIAQAARRGVLIKGGVHLENLGHLDTVALDKTGTLTTGQFAVTQVIGFDGTAEDEVLRIAAAVEEQSSHPLAAAIVKTAKERNITFPTATEIENLAGKGMKARVEGADVLVGAMRAFAADPAAKKGGSLAETIARLEGEGQTTVIIRFAGKFIGVIALADEPRVLVKEVMQRLRAQGIDRLIMLTGDNASVAHRIAEQVGITEVRAELLPGDKLTLIRELQHGHGVIAMIGDGVNDAPALAAASVGVAMGAGGTAVALETADVVLMGDDLGKLPFAIGLSRASARIIRQNLVIALGVIGMLLIASGFGVIPLSVAVVLHEGSTLVVVLNALRLLAWHEKMG